MYLGLKIPNYSRGAVKYLVRGFVTRILASDKVVDLRPLLKEARLHPVVTGTGSNEQELKTETIRTDET